MTGVSKSLVAIYPPLRALSRSQQLTLTPMPAGPGVPRGARAVAQVLRPATRCAPKDQLWFRCQRAL